MLKHYPSYVEIVTVMQSLILLNLK